MANQETIQLLSHRDGTLVKFFTNFEGQTSVDGTITYLVCDMTGTPLTIVDSLLDTQTFRDPNNNFVEVKNLTVYSGSTLQTEREFLTPSERNVISSNYIESIRQQFLASTNNSGNTALLRSYVTFENTRLDDMYINLMIHRDIDTLDTFNVYNLPINEIPTFTNNTGVLFGRLEAVQKVLDENGQKIRIPLKNTTVGIFNPSDTFPTLTSTDDDGDRISLNLKENVRKEFYFNDQSVVTDLSFLKDSNAFDGLPDQYKYTTTTDENGEFILYDVPIGNQTFMYEVDLLKQGLTHDEVALNFFAYPADESPNLDTVPHYFFRQIPVNIVPSWGTNQTGYTELNLSVNLDLRKWITYYISPVAYSRQRLEERYFTQGDNTPLMVQVRDMTKKNYELKNIELDIIEKLTDKVTDQALEWVGEYKQLVTKAQFFSTDYHIVKLPANLYDPNGASTNYVNGQTPFKGVWLGAYQLKMFYKSLNISRSTGLQVDWDSASSTVIYSSHFDLDKNGSVVGKFPYEKPWSLTYPESYHIPQPPTQQNTNKKYDSTYGFPLVQTEPKFLDGDMAGRDPDPNDLLAYGYGVQDVDGGGWSENIFSRRVTQNAVYKYESGVRWDELYSNGYNRYMNIPGLPKVSEVLNGERYQRVEGGYGYWLKPEGWPRIVNNGWGDVIARFDLADRNTNAQLQATPSDVNTNGVGPGTYKDSTYIVQLNNNISLKLDSSNPLKQGSLDIYRVIHPEEVLPPEYLSDDTYVDLDFVRIYREDSSPTCFQDNHRINSYPDRVDRIARDGSFFNDGMNQWGFNLVALPLPYWNSGGYAIVDWSFSHNGVKHSGGSHPAGPFNPYGHVIVAEGSGGFVPWLFPDVNVVITNDGIRDVSVTIKGKEYTILVGKSITLYDQDIFEYDYRLKLRLPGNYALKGKTNSYTKAKYKIIINGVKVPIDWVQWDAFGRHESYFGIGIDEIDVDAGPLTGNTAPTYYLRSRQQSVVIPRKGWWDNTYPQSELITYVYMWEVEMQGIGFGHWIDGGGNTTGGVGGSCIRAFFDKNKIASDDGSNFNLIPWRLITDG